VKRNRTFRSSPFNLKVCGVSHADLLSARFNGLNAIGLFREHGIDYRLLSDIHQRKTGKSITPVLFRKIAAIILKIESKTGFQSRLYFWSIGISIRKEFRIAEVVHYHILHNNFFRIESLKYLMRIKPSVWTLHDLWITTGHCIQPLDCKRYGHGCGHCPSLTRTISVERDRTKHEYRRKVNLISKLNCDFIVSTNWMKSRVLSNLPIKPERLHVIPFGVDTNTFRPITDVARKELRLKHSIADSKFTVFINAHDDEIKGINIVKELISMARYLVDVEFILVDASQLFLFKENVVSFPRATSEKEIIDLIQLADLVVIPSLGESFSLLALEAMSCGKAVVALENSAPHEVTGSSKDYVFSESESAKNICRIIENALRDRASIHEEGTRNRKRVLSKFTIERHVSDISSLYVRIGEQ